MTNHQAIAALFLSLFTFTLGAATMQAVFLYEIASARPAQRNEETAAVRLTSTATSHAAQQMACSLHHNRPAPVALAQVR